MQDNSLGAACNILKPLITSQTLRIRLMTANDDDESSWHSAMDILEARSETRSMASARHPHTDQLDIADNNTIQKKKKQKKHKTKKSQKRKKASVRSTSEPSHKTLVTRPSSARQRSPGRLRRSDTPAANYHRNKMTIQNSWTSAVIIFGWTLANLKQLLLRR